MNRYTRSQSVGEEIAGKSWYYGQISRGDCDALMAERGQDGDFLVRDSESNVSRAVQIRLSSLGTTKSI